MHAGVLRELDASLADNEQASVQWEVVKVSMNSPLTVTLGPRVPAKRRDTSAEIVKSFVLGSRSLELRATVPSNWTDEALVRMRKLVDLRSDGIASMVFRTQGEDAVEPTLHTAANIEEIQKQTTTHYWEHTSIEGAAGGNFRAQRNPHLDLGSSDEHEG
jgi:hypothetical protein